LITPVLLCAGEATSTYFFATYPSERLPDEYGIEEELGLERSAFCLFYVIGRP
jgi:hypothetical protein